MRKVYVSSTYKDLEQERQAARDALLMLGHHPVAMETYVSTEQKPIVRVRQDIFDCDLFIGIYGLRYGFTPPGHQKSITHLEYEAAGEAGIPRLLFVRDEAATWKLVNVDADRTKVDTFRAEVLNQHVVSHFQTPEELRSKVLAAVSVSDQHSSLPGQPEVPHLLPYLCDRSEQETELERALMAHQLQASERPFVCVVHGDVHECHDMFVERMRKHLLPKYLGHGPSEPPLKQYDIEWPVIATKITKRMDLLRANLGAKLCDTRVATVEKMMLAIAAQAVPVMIVTNIYWQTWAADELKLIRSWLRFWSEWPLGGESRQLIVIMCVHYKVGDEGGEGPGGARAASAMHKLMQEQMDALQYRRYDLSGVTLPPLRGIPLGEVDNWARNYGAQFRPPNEVLRQARQFYARLHAEGMGAHVSMEKLAPLLKLWMAAPVERQVN